MSNLTVAVYFTKSSGTPATGLTLTDIALYLTAHNKSTGVDTVIWDGTQNPDGEIDNIGAYTKIYSSADLSTYDYFARGTYSGGTTLDYNHVQGGTASAEVSTTTAQSIADQVLIRGVSNVEDTADATSLAAIILGAFESAISGTTWTIYKTDHSTTFTTRTVTADSSANPIVEVT